MNVPGLGVGIKILYVAAGYRNSIYTVHQIKKEIHPSWGVFLFCVGVIVKLFDLFQERDILKIVKTEGNDGKNGTGFIAASL